MRRHRHMFHPSLLTLLVLAGFIGAAAPAKAQEPALAYIRFNRYGTQINVLYCAVANYQTIFYGESSPGYWTSEKHFGSINNCTSSVPYWYSVAGNETLGFQIFLQADFYRGYSFEIYPTGSSNLSCAFKPEGSNDLVVRDTRLVSSTACAFIRQ